MTMLFLGAPTGVLPAGAFFIFRHPSKNEIGVIPHCRVPGNVFAAPAKNRRATRPKTRSGNTDYLVVGENPGRKLEDAREEQVEIIDEEAFEKMVAGKG
jgi:hypothetical protein